MYKYIISWLCILLISCNDRQTKLSFQPLPVENTSYIKGTVLCDSLLMKLVGDIDYYDSCLIVSAYSEGYFMHCYDRNTGKFIQHRFAKGRGPGEILAMSSINLNRNSGKMSFFDPVASKKYEYELDSILTTYTGEGRLMKNALRNVMPLNDYFLAGMGAGKDTDGHYRRLHLMREDSVIFRYWDYPLWGNGIKKQIALFYCYTGQLEVAPDRKHFVVTTSLGAILEIFSATRDSIHLETTKGFIEPIFDLHQNQVYPLPNQTIWGFHDLYPTDRYIYTLYSGNTEGSKNPVNIAVFDWQGNLVKFYRTSFPLKRLCVDEQNKELFAVGLNADYETVIIKFKLDLL